MFSFKPNLGMEHRKRMWNMSSFWYFKAQWTLNGDIMITLNQLQGLSFFYRSSSWKAWTDHSSASSPIECNVVVTTLKKPLSSLSLKLTVPFVLGRSKGASPCSTTFCHGKASWAHFNPHLRLYMERASPKWFNCLVFSPSGTYIVRIKSTISIWHKPC